MHVEWDENRCALSGLCTGLAPDVFQLADDAHVQISIDLDEPQRQSARDAADACPTQAIRVLD